MKKRTWVVIAVSTIVFFVMGWLVGQSSGAKKLLAYSHDQQAVRSSGYTLINPLLECEISDQTIRTMVLPFKDELTDEVESIKRQYDVDHISVYFRDLNNGIWLGVDETEEFSPASLLKVPLLVSYLKKAQTEPDLLDQVIVDTLGQDLNEKQTIVTGPNLQQGMPYKVRELLEHMIYYSSNNAAALLAATLDREELDRVYADFGLPKVAGTVQSYNVNVRQYASFFRILFNASYLNEDMSEQALKLLSESKYLDGLVAGVPQGIRVAHKFGERNFLSSKTSQLHDCGIVYFPNHPYLLCVMTKGRAGTNLSAAIAGVSARVYREVDRQVSERP